MTDLKPLTEQQLTDIETCANAATAGPWCTDSWEIYQGGEDDIPALMKWIGETCRADDSDGSRNDAAFIAHARTDVPALLAEIRRLRAELDEAAEDVSWLRCLEAAGVDNWEGYDEAIQAAESASS